MTEDAPQRHWSREPWVWLLIALPLSAIIGGIVTTVLAVRSNDGLVVDDYYRRGLEINRTLDRDRRAAEAGLSADLNWSNDRRTLNLQLTARPGFAAPAFLTVNLLHATRAGLDQIVTLHGQAPGEYAGAVQPLEAGRWYVQIEAADWRLVKPIRVY